MHADLVGDEFDGPAGSPPDPGTWRPETGGHGWGSAELPYYTGGTENAWLDYVRVYTGTAATD
jgi:hypothetical protein